MKAGKKKKSIFLRVALLAFSVYVLVSLVQLQMDIQKRQQQLDDINEQIRVQTSLNEDVQNKTDHYERYLEEKSREQGLARPGETIYKEIPADSSEN